MSVPQTVLVVLGTLCIIAVFSVSAPLLQALFALVGVFALYFWYSNRKK